MISRESIKHEVDKVQEQYLDVLYRIIKALVPRSDSEFDLIKEATVNKIWQEFVNSNYGLFANDPLVRGEQGQYEVREAIE
jgi:hypothetical protein